MWWWRKRWTVPTATTHGEHREHRRHHRWTPIATHARRHSPHATSVFHTSPLLPVIPLPGAFLSSRRSCATIGNCPGVGHCDSRRCRRNLNVVVEIYEPGIVAKLVRVEHCSHIPGTHRPWPARFEALPSGHPVESTSTLVWNHFGGDHFVH